MSKPTKSPNPADVARWVEAIRLEPDNAKTGSDAQVRRRRATNARANLAKHNLGTNGRPLGRIQ